MPRQEMTLHCRRRRLTNAGSDRVQMTFSLKVARDSRGQGRWSLSLTNRESVLGGPCPRQAEARVGTRDRAVTQGTAVTTLDLEPLNHHGTPKVHSYIWEEKIFFFLKQKMLLTCELYFREFQRSGLLVLQAYDVLLMCV